jgi:hypothetical protein
MLKELFKYGSGPTQVEKEYNKRYSLYVIPLYFLMFLIVLSCLLALWSMIYGDNYYFIIIFFIILGLTYIFGNFFGKKIIKNDYSYGVGSMAEDLTTAKLTSLGDSFFIINDVSKGRYKENIDHVVVGPTGLFIIETKANTNDQIFYYKNSIRKITSFGYKSLKQVSRNSLWIHKLIKNNLKLTVWAQGLIVRPLKEDGKIECYLDNRVCILDGDEVCGYIKNYKSRLNNDEINKIYNLLNKIKRSLS